MIWLNKLTNAIRRRSKVVQIETMPTGKVRYRLTDPAAPLIVKEESFPVDSVQPPIQVMGLGEGDIGTPGGQAMGVYMTIRNAILHYNSYAEKIHSHWQNGSTLQVLPRAGRQLNAYYNRQVLAFFFGRDQQLNRDVYTSDSPDVVTHELGHAILDSVRPDFWNTTNLEVWAFHECYGDVLSIISALQHPEVAQLVLDVTSGDLRKDNPVACLAEELAHADFSTGQPDGRNPAWLRNANNNFKYVSPLGLPDDGPSDVIVGEPHSFSRIMTGALYDCLVVIYQNELQSGRDALTALMNAGKGLGWYLNRAVARVMIKGKFFQSFAKSMLDVDRELSHKFYQDRFERIFQDRGILPTNPQLILEAHKGTGNLVEIRLTDHLPLRAMSMNHLHNVLLQVADDGLDSILAAQDAVNYIYNHKKLGNDNIFRVSDGKLQRNYILCGWRNWQNPTQPEYQKPPKPENHFQQCGCNRAVNHSSQTVVYEVNTRYKNGTA